MASPYEMERIGNEARRLGLLMVSRIPQKDWNTNEDQKKVTFVERTLLRSGLDDYIDYEVVMIELDEIRQKYKGMPRLTEIHNKIEAEHLAKTA